MAKVERKLDSLLVKQDVNSMRQMGHLATKYMGKQNGFQGGTHLNLSSSVELSGSAGTGGCTVLGTTRALGLEKRLAVHGGKTLTVYQPSIDYPDLSQATHITREYTGYMALHIGEIEAPGTAWAFDKELRLKQVLPVYRLSHQILHQFIYATPFTTSFSDVFLAWLSNGEGRENV